MSYSHFIAHSVNSTTRSTQTPTRIMLCTSARPIKASLITSPAIQLSRTTLNQHHRRSTRMNSPSLSHASPHIREQHHAINPPSTSDPSRCTGIPIKVSLITSPAIQVSSPNLNHDQHCSRNVNNTPAIHTSSHIREQHRAQSAPRDQRYPEQRRVALHRPPHQSVFNHIPQRFNSHAQL